MDIEAFKNYELYSSTDFICDPFFQEWVIAATEAQDSFWQQFLVLYPARAEAVRDARLFLQGLRFAESYPSDTMVEAAFERHCLAVAEEQQEEYVPVGRQPVLMRMRKVWQAAGVLLIVLLLVGLFTWRKTRVQQQEVATRYGVTRKVVLPDSSLVLLNGNSRLQYAANWDKTKSREVWLQGEAYFEIKHQAVKGNVLPPFTVHTAYVVVNVLGTSFDIRERRDVTEVMLESGAVALSFTDSSHAGMLLKPGDIVVYQHQQKQVVKDTTNAGNYSAWKTNKLVLRNPTVREIVHYLEDNYGYTITVEDAAMWNRKVNGPILYDNLDDALFILSTVLNVHVIKKDSVITLRPR